MDKARRHPLPSSSSSKDSNKESDANSNHNGNGNGNELDLPPQCIPTKVKRVRRHIQLIDDEYTKYKYELKLDEKQTTVVPFPYIDKEFAERNKFEIPSSSSKKRKSKQNE